MQVNRQRAADVAAKTLALPVFQLVLRLLDNMSRLDTLRSHFPDMVRLVLWPWGNLFMFLGALVLLFWSVRERREPSKLVVPHTFGIEPSRLPRKTLLIWCGLGLTAAVVVFASSLALRPHHETPAARPQAGSTAIAPAAQPKTTEKATAAPNTTPPAATVSLDTQNPSETNPKSTTAPPIRPKKQEPQRVAAGMTPTVGIMVQRGGQATPSTEFEYISNGLGAQAANIGAKPLKVWFAPSEVTLEPKDLPKELTINGNKVTISEFTGTGFTIDDHGIQGIKVSGHVLEGKKSASEQPPASPPPIQITNIAPGGFAISGGNVFNPTVNNLGPPPSPTPNVAVCISQATAPNTRQNITTIKLKTDVPITLPWYAFFFDGPIGAGSVGMDNHVPGYSPGRATKMLNPDRSFVFRVFSIDFGTNVWSPNDQINVTIPSEKPVHLERILSGSGNEGIFETFTFPCGAAPSQN